MSHFQNFLVRSRILLILRVMIISVNTDYQILFPNCEIWSLLHFVSTVSFFFPLRQYTTSVYVWCTSPSYATPLHIRKSLILTSQKIKHTTTTTTHRQRDNCISNSIWFEMGVLCYKPYQVFIPICLTKPDHEQN